MTEFITIPFICPCKEEQLMSQSFLVEGSGMSTVQLWCQNPDCKELLSYDIPWKLASTEHVTRTIPPYDPNQPNF